VLDIPDLPTVIYAATYILFVTCHYSVDRHASEVPDLTNVTFVVPYRYPICDLPLNISVLDIPDLPNVIFVVAHILYL